MKWSGCKLDENSSARGEFWQSGKRSESGGEQITGGGWGPTHRKAGGMGDRRAVVGKKKKEFIFKQGNGIGWGGKVKKRMQGGI